MQSNNDPQNIKPSLETPINGYLPIPKQINFLPNTNFGNFNFDALTQKINL